MWVIQCKFSAVTYSGHRLATHRPTFIDARITIKINGLCVCKKRGKVSERVQKGRVPVS
jgi:hypothetical protein